MYIIRGHIGRRGFSLQKDGRHIFATKHSFGFLRTSKISIGAAKIAIKSQNLIGSKFQIFKDGHEIGSLDFTSYLYSVLSLQKKDGSVDIFKFEEDGFSQIFTLSQAGQKILKITTSLNPINLSEKYTVEVVSDRFSAEAIEELIFYCGEILFRNLSSNAGTQF